MTEISALPILAFKIGPNLFDISRDLHQVSIRDQIHRATVLIEGLVGAEQLRAGIDEVLIVGAGVAGATAASLLARHGIKACVIDASAEPFSKQRDNSKRRVGPYMYEWPLAAFNSQQLASKRMSVLLFTAREPTAREVAARGGYGKLFAFKGVFNVAEYEFFVPTEGRRLGDRLLRFRLLSADGDGVLALDKAALDVSLENLAAVQDRLNAQAAEGVESRFSVAEYRRRSVEVHRYARRRAAGICEGCALTAPFVDFDGDAFLEVHHLIRLADDGPDSPANVAAICPNCHRRAHYSADRDSFNHQLRQNVQVVETNITAGAFDLV